MKHMDADTYRTIASAVHGYTHASAEARNGFSVLEHSRGANGHPAYLAVLEHLLPMVPGRKPDLPRVGDLDQNTMPAGTIIHLRGFPFILCSAARVYGYNSNFSAAMLEQVEAEAQTSIASA